MDIVRFKGGLGNQMFQYAFYEALKSRKRQVKASLGFYHKHPEARRFCLTETFPGIVLDDIPDQDFDRIDVAWKEIKQDAIKMEGTVYKMDSAGTSFLFDSVIWPWIRQNIHIDFKIKCKSSTNQAESACPVPQKNL